MNKSYEKLSFIKEGNFGRVYLCNHKLFKQVAVKEMTMDDLTINERTTVLREIKEFPQIRNEFIVKIFDATFDNLELVVIMEYMAGGNLTEYFGEFNSNNRIPLDFVKNIWIQILLAISFIHSKSIIHRDLKPDNILFMADRKILKISDFGVSKVLESQSKAMTLVGSPAYMSPELCKRKPYDFKTDMWAVGCIFYECLCLKLPFGGKNIVDLNESIVKCSYDKNILYNIVKSKEPREIVESLIRRKPEERPSAQSLLSHNYLSCKLFALRTTLGEIDIRKFGEMDPKRVQKKIFKDKTFDENFSLSHYTIEDGRIRKDFQETFENAIVEVAECQEYIGVLFENQKCQVLIKKNEMQRIEINKIYSLNIRHIYGAASYFLVLSSNGLLVTFGSSNNACLGHGEDLTELSINSMRSIQSLFDEVVIEVSCTSTHWLGITNKNEVIGCGGILEENCLPANLEFDEPQPIMLDNIKKTVEHVDCFCGRYCSFILTRRKDIEELYAYGNNECNRLGLLLQPKIKCGNKTNSSFELCHEINQYIQQNEKLIDVSCETCTTIILTSRSLYILGNSNNHCYHKSVRIETPFAGIILRCFVISKIFYLLTIDARLFQFDIKHKLKLVKTFENYTSKFAISLFLNNLILAS
ncbi:hypothetical protein SNEBB_006151 [Seison nebaliae]|nr:hypothetical protein SNEBB_006151 [Seison nebaliae]